MHLDFKLSKLHFVHVGTHGGGKKNLLRVNFYTRNQKELLRIIAVGAGDPPPASVGVKLLSPSSLLLVGWGTTLPPHPMLRQKQERCTWKPILYEPGAQLPGLLISRDCSRGGLTEYEM